MECYQLASPASLHFHRFVVAGALSFLILLVLRNEVLHVRFGLRELHLVHAFARVPVKESLATEHRGELAPYALEDFLDGRGVAEESGRHGQAIGRDVAHGKLYIVWNPLDEVA